MFLADPERRDAILSAADARSRPVFAGRVLSADEETWVIWKEMEHQGRKRRHTCPQPDLVIAALSRQHDLAVVTRDTAPFVEAGVAFLNPWNE